MKKVLFYLLIVLFAVFISCKKEYSLPTVNTPSDQTVEVGAEVDITFNFSAEGGFKSANLAASNGTAAIKTNGTAGDVTGSLVVTFTAGTTSGAGSVTLTIVDDQDQSVTATAVISVFEMGAPAVTAPANSDVEVMKPVDLSFEFTAEGGYSSSTLVASNGTAVIKTDGNAGATSGIVVVTYTADRTIGAGSVAIKVKDSNNKEGIATAVINVVGVPTISVTDNIEEDVTWETGKIYVLNGRIAVLSGATLTIEHGVIIKGGEGSGSNAKALIIARGGKLMAEGTSSSPIIFTSIADEILPGEIVSPNLEPTLNGLWGGLIVLGNAPISASTSPKQIEGIPPSDQNGLYGGDDPLDNSGSIMYISIRHGGANIGEGNEINGLTLGGIGSGTTIENVEIIANQDDGIEWFGGTVNVKNVIFWNVGDDAVDTDQSWGGTLDNFIIINPSDECFELDGPEGTMVATHTIKNGSVKAIDAEGLADLDDNTPVNMSKIYFFDIKIPQDFDDMPIPASGGLLTASDLQVTLPVGTVLTDFFKEGTDAFVTAVNAGTNTVGADKSVFNTWSWAAVSGNLSDF